MENKNAIKQFLMRNFSEKYGAARDYYDRFSDLYSVFFLLAVLCQLWAGWAESHFFAAEMDGVVSFPSPSWALGAGLLAAILFEVTKTRIGKKLLEELYGYQNTLHAPLLAVWVVMMGISALIGYVGIGEYTAGHRAASAPTDSLTAQVDALYLPQISAAQQGIDGFVRKYTWKGRYNGIPAQSWEGGPPQKTLDADRAMMQSLEKRLAMLQEQHMRERQTAQGAHSSALSAYHAETEEKVFSGRFFTIATELIYALCLWWNAYFAAQSAYTANIAGSIPPPNGGGNGGGGSPSGGNTPPPSGHQHQPQHTPQPAKLNGHHRPINGQPFPYNLPDNSHQGQHPQASTAQAPPPLPQFQPPTTQGVTEDTVDSVTESQKPPNVAGLESSLETAIETIETVMETRTCAHCGKAFKVDTRRDPIARPKKYCSTECLNEGRKESNRIRRSVGKWKVIRNDLETPSRSIEWGKDEAV